MYRGFSDFQEAINMFSGRRRHKNMIYSNQRRGETANQKYFSWYNFPSDLEKKENA